MAVLTEAQGYGIVVGLGLGFAFLIMLISWFLKKYAHEVQTSEEFNTAGRSVKTGLIAAAVCSSWTWAATLLQSTSTGYRYGVSGPFWYASGATVQIILFASLAIELKRRAPSAHTYLELIRARYGTGAHITYLVFATFTNILVTLMLLTGGSAVVNYLTGIPTAAACFLIPIPVILFTVFGGLKATIMSDYTHSALVLIFILVFTFKIYVTSPELGSFGKVWELLQEASRNEPVEGNEQGSYLTMRSKDGGIFFVINIVGNFGTVFLDQGYWQKAISSDIGAALNGYVLGGISWFSIPFLCATTMGLAGVALQNNPVWPSYPNRLPEADVSAGLVLPNVAVALMGQQGALIALVLLFLAVSSAFSSELVAVSSIFTYDVYRTYINPQASGRRLRNLSHIAVVGFSFFIAGFSVGLWYIGISLGYLYLMMGVVISSAVLPAACTMLSTKQNKIAVIASPILGTICSFIGWFVTAYKKFGVINVASTGSNDPMLVGNLVALLSPILFIPLFTFAFGPQNYDWTSMRTDIKLVDDSEFLKEDANIRTIQHIAEGEEYEEQQKMLKRKSLIAKVLASGLTICLLLLWPIPMYGSKYVFSKSFFEGWVVVGIIWAFVALGITGVYPLWEGRKSMARVGEGFVLAITGKSPTTVTHGIPQEQGSDVDEKRASPTGKEASV
ncbi:hypothetical protein H072_2174 [Dactylellina haptotyla CBS 200.50]|uniref:Urea active transporter n=1 Tax=Dactylellina haptotyla (strain CBS 200.50) TaxID=1284197 RepID=S8BWR1_DACHA|nr:hypothetical protein H072_2174 [Dactylellina haptotyla CBS 200.50]